MLKIVILNQFKFGQLRNKMYCYW